MLVPRTYPLLVTAVVEGVLLGWNRAWKHREDPQPENADFIRIKIEEAVLDSILERFEPVEECVEDKPEHCTCS